jgi:hypothetical protein
MKPEIKKDNEPFFAQKESSFAQELFTPCAAENSRLQERLLALIDTLFPVPQRFHDAIPNAVQDLSRLLTSGRSALNGAYLGQPALLQAYLRYFLPWNIYRLCRLLPSLPFELVDDDLVLDLGAGPLTFPLALWITHPELRQRRLRIVCIDKNAAALKAGQKIFQAFIGAAQAADGGAWHIRTVHTSINSALAENKNARLISAVNVYNELYQQIPLGDREGLRLFAQKTAALLSPKLRDDGALFIAEPGNPRGGEFIALLRASFLRNGLSPAAPCTHLNECPLPACKTVRKDNAKSKWCHFVFGTGDAPRDLQKLSVKAHLKKETASLSFLLARQQADAAHNDSTVRVLSEAFPLPPQSGAAYGRYACSGRGLVLIAGGQRVANGLRPGMLAVLRAEQKPRLDPKTGALVARLVGEA